MNLGVYALKTGRRLAKEAIFLLETAVRGIFFYQLHFYKQVIRDNDLSGNYADTCKGLDPLCEYFPTIDLQLALLKWLRQRHY